MGGNLSGTNKRMEVPLKASASSAKFSAETAKFLVMPIYYTKDALSAIELDAALSVWKDISSNKAQNFVLQKQTDSAFRSKYALCSEYFYDIFFDRLSDVHPGSRGLFSKSGQRMRQYFLASLTMILSLLNEPVKLNKTLTHLAQVHNKIGVKGVECKLILFYLFYLYHSVTDGVVF